VALLDIGLPGIDGSEVARRMRRLLALDDALLVALTGWGQKDDRRRSAEASFDEHFVKPPRRARPLPRTVVARGAGPDLQASRSRAISSLTPR
jgi:CheY-like chemotaxis protein